MTPEGAVVRSRPEPAGEPEAVVPSESEVAEIADAKPADTPSTGPASELPVTVIERRRGWQLVDLGELWRYRELLFFLAWRDVKVRYKQTVLGAAWAVLQPLATMIVFSLFLARSGALPAGETPYPLFVFCGLLPWFLFAGAVTAASQSVIGNQNLVTKVYFPRLFIPIGAAGAAVVDFAVAFVLLLGMMLLYQAPISWCILLVPLLVLGVLVAALGLGILLSALTVNYRDFRYVVPFMVQLWMFATPSIYLRTDLAFGPRSRLLLTLNPAEGFIAAFRQAVLGHPLDWTGLAVSCLIALVLLLSGCLYFRRVERGFADVI